MKQKQKRIPRSYKACDKSYNRAVKNASRHKIKVSQLVEQVIDLFGPAQHISVSVTHSDGSILAYDLIELVQSVNSKP